MGGPVSWNREPNQPRASEKRARSVRRDGNQRKEEGQRLSNVPVGTTGWAPVNKLPLLEMVRGGSASAVCVGASAFCASGLAAGLVASACCVSGFGGSRRGWPAAATAVGFGAGWGTAVGVGARWGAVMAAAAAGRAAGLSSLPKPSTRAIELPLDENRLPNTLPPVEAVLSSLLLRDASEVGVLPRCAGRGIGTSA